MNAPTTLLAADDRRPTFNPATREELVARAREVAKVLAKNATQVDEECLIPEENLAAIRDAGLSLLLQPAQFGGNEVDLRTSLEVQVELARGCGSTAWVTGLGNVSSFLAAFYPMEAQNEIWGESIHNRICCVTSPAGAKKTDVEGGWRISGKWRYASGSAYAQWAVVGVPTVQTENFSTSSHAGYEDGSENPDVGLALVPMSDLTIEKSWNVTGMRGTRSDTIVAEDVFVPKHRQLTYGGLMSGKLACPYDTVDHPLYRTPFLTVFGLCLAAAQVGLAKSAMDFTLGFAPQRLHPYSQRRLSEESTVQTLLGEAAYTADSGELHLMRAADDADAAAARGEWLQGAKGLRGLIDGMAAARYSTDAIRLMIRAIMSSSFNKSCPLQRFWRDCEIASTHLGWSNFQLEGYGKGLLGLDTE